MWPLCHPGYKKGAALFCEAAEKGSRGMKRDRVQGTRAKKKEWGVENEKKRNRRRRRRE